MAKTQFFDAASPVGDIWYKGQRVLRTILQVGVPAFLSFAGVLPLVIDALGLPVTGGLYLWLVAFAGGVTAVAAGLSRVMAIPAVNAWLVKFGLGSVPAAAADTAVDPAATPDEVDAAEPSNGDVLVEGDGLASDTAK